MEELVTIAADASTEYVGRWNRLVSTTNWQKGEIIHQWRESLRANDAPPDEYTDEAWSKTVGGVSPQHVGRLRRVFERFDAVHDQYEGLYWSHFLAALDWDDAEMYLEGAVQNNWSVPQMKQQRQQTTGEIEADDKQSDAELVISQPEVDISDETDAEEKLPDTISEKISEVQDDESADESDSAEASDNSPPSALPSTAAPVRPFESLPPLPADVSEAFELMKLSILAHKVTKWHDFAQEDFLSVLESLRQLVLAPAE